MRRVGNFVEPRFSLLPPWRRKDFGVRHGGGATFFGSALGAEDFFGVYPKKVPPFFCPKKAKKLYKNWPDPEG